MKDCRTSLFVAALLAFFAVFSIPNASAATPSPSFTITAANVTMSTNTSSGIGSSSFTLTSVNGYTGSIRVSCNLPTPVSGVNVPFCGDGVPAVPAAIPVAPPITLTANESVIGAIAFYNANVPCGNPCPVSLPRPMSHGLSQGLALAGVFLFGLGSRRRARRWLALIFLSLGSLVGIAGISACGGNNSVVTPGTYVYTISATDTTTAVTVTTSVNVTVP